MKMQAILGNSGGICQICRQKNERTMVRYRLEFCSDFEQLCEMLLADSFKSTKLNFAQLSSVLLADRVAMDNKFYEYFGLSGDDVLDLLRSKVLIL